jgi:hypothetical protein
MASSISHSPLPPPRGGHTPAAIMVMIEPMASGGYRLSTPYARGWAARVQTPLQLARGVQQAITEVQVAAYAKAHGMVYDLDGMTGQVAGDPLAGRPVTREARPRRGRRSHSPADWVMTDNGSWKSPKGRVYGPATQIVQRVLEGRRRMGLTTG